MTNATSSPEPTPQPKVKKGHPNPERLDQTIEIIEPPSRVFIVASISTLTALMVWAFTAEIPATVPAQGVFIEPYSIIQIKSTGNGRFFFKSDISRKTASQLTRFVEVITDQMTYLMNHPSEVAPISTVNLITNVINNFFSISTQASLDINMLKEQQHDKRKLDIQYKGGEEIGFILNEQTALNFAGQLAAYSQKNIYSNVSSKANNQLLEKGNALDNALSQRVKTMQELASLGVVAKSSVLQTKQQQLQQIQSNIDQKLSIQSSKSNVYLGLTQLLGSIVASTRGIVLRSDQNIIILSKLISSGSIVTTNQSIAIASARMTGPSVISCFIPGTSFSGVERGDMVLVSPVNVDQNTYGSIIGHIVDISAVALSSDDALNVIGDPGSTQTLFKSSQALFFATVKLQAAKNSSGYEWTSSNGPPFRIPITTIANIKIVTHSYKPYQIVLPFLKSITGKS